MATKKEIVKMLLNKELDTEDEAQLLDMLVEQPISIDVDKQDKDSEKIGDRLADLLTEKAGSWTFIVCFCLFLLFWVVLNSVIMIEGFDEYPFILLNLFLSCIAALQAPIIMMSQNRQSKKESLRNNNDYRVDLKSELMLEEIHEKMNKIIVNQNKLFKMLEPPVEEETKEQPKS